MAFSGNVLKVIPNAGNTSDVTIALTLATPTDLWVGIDILFPPGTGTFVLDPANLGTPNVVAVGSAGSETLARLDLNCSDAGPVYTSIRWATNFTDLSTDIAASDTEYHIDVHMTATDMDWYVDGVHKYHATVSYGSGFDELWVGLSNNWTSDQTMIFYVDNVTVGTTQGGSEIFADDFETADFSLWDTTTNVSSLSFVDAATVGGGGGGGSSEVGRVLIAFDDTPLEPDPVWTRIDDTDNLVSGIDINTGKQTEFDRTDTGTMTVYLNDTAGLFDPMNVSSPYFGKLDGKQILAQLWNPVTLLWEQQWRGWIDDYGYDINAAVNAAGEPLVANIQVDCVDVFDYLGGYQLQPYPVNGDTPPGGSEGTILYEDTAGTVADRFIQVLSEASIDSSRYVVFTGNVKVQESKYDPGDALLNVLRDAADAEFPGIANIYVDRFGRFVFHGRYARFDPEGVIAAGPVSTDTWDFNRWKVGDGAAIVGDSDYAQIRVLSYSHGRADIVNSAIAWPQHDPSEDHKIATQVFEDATSIGDYGKHSLSPMTELVIQEGTTTGNDKWVECAKFAEFFVHYLKDPQTRITTLMVKAIGPADPRAAATWDVLCRADISDIVGVKVGYPGGTGIDDDNYIEGYTKRIRPLNPTHDYVEAEYRLTPTAWSMDPDGVFA